MDAETPKLSTAIERQAPIKGNYGGGTLYPVAKGYSGNPSGRPRVPVHVKEAARCYTKEALETLIDVCRDKDAPPGARVLAAEAILNRAWGKPEATSNVNINRPLTQLTDAELVEIINSEQQAGSGGTVPSADQSEG